MERNRSIQIDSSNVEDRSESFDLPNVAPPKVDPDFLLQIKTRSPDLFYKIIAELNNDNLTQLCSLSSEFQKICHDNEFWERLWRMKFKGVPPLDIKGEYLDRNFFSPVVDFLYQYRQKPDRPYPKFSLRMGETKDQILTFLRTIPKSVSGESTLGKLKTIAIRYNNPDLYLYVVLNGLPMNSGEVNDLRHRGKSELLEGLLANYSSQTILKLLRNLSLSEIIRLPRSPENRCNLYPLNIVFQERVKAYQSGSISQFLRDLEKTIEKAYFEECPEIIDYLIGEIRKVKFINFGMFVQNIIPFVIHYYDLERFKELSSEVPLKNVLIYIDKLSDKEEKNKLIEYLLTQENYDFQADLIESIKSGNYYVFEYFFPYLRDRNSHLLTEFIHTYLTNQRHIDDDFEYYLVDNIDPDILQRIFEDPEYSSKYPKELKSFKKTFTKYYS